MKQILAYKKETENKFRWDAIVDNTPFEIYIPKWRIPEPVPDRISIKIFTEKDKELSLDKYSPEEVDKNPLLKTKAIFSELKYSSDHSKTFRYNPVGDKKSWEIGSPYIPKSLLDDKPINELFINIEWR